MPSRSSSLTSSTKRRGRIWIRRCRFASLTVQGSRSSRVQGSRSSKFKARCSRRGFFYGLTENYVSQKAQKTQKLFRLTAKIKVTQIARIAQIMLALRQAAEGIKLRWIKGQVSYQFLANCHIKIRPTATFILRKMAEIGNKFVPLQRKLV